MIAISTALPLAAAIVTIVHTAQTPFNLIEISQLGHYPRHQSSEKTTKVRNPVFDHDYNLIGYN